MEVEIEMSKDECQTIIDALEIARLNYLRLSQVGTEENRMLKKAKKTAKLIDDFEKDIILFYTKEQIDEMFEDEYNKLKKELTEMDLIKIKEAEK